MNTGSFRSKERLGSTAKRSFKDVVTEVISHFVRYEMTSIYVTLRHNMTQYRRVSHGHEIQWAVPIKLSFGYSSLCENGAWFKPKPVISGNFLARKYRAKTNGGIAYNKRKL